MSQSLTTGNILRFWLGGSNGVNCDNETTGFTFSASTWFHVVAQSASIGGAVDLYVNGVNKYGYHSGHITADFANAASTYYIANNDSPSGTRGVDGLIDEFGIWGRALTTTEIADLYNAGNGLTYPF